jgi:hypothetical protein
MTATHGTLSVGFGAMRIGGHVSAVLRHRFSVCVRRQLTKRLYQRGQSDGAVCQPLGGIAER